MISLFLMQETRRLKNNNREDSTQDMSKIHIQDSKRNIKKDKKKEVINKVDLDQDRTKEIKKDIKNDQIPQIAIRIRKKSDQNINHNLIVDNLKKI